MLSLVQSLKALNLIDGVGFQSHFIVGEVPQDLQTNLQRFANAGVDVAITELDVRVLLAVYSGRSLAYSISINLLLSSLLF